MSSILQHPSLALGEENISHADPRGFLCTPFDTSVQSVSMHCPLQRLLVRKWPARFLCFLSTSFLICGCSSPPTSPLILPQFSQNQHVIIDHISSILFFLCFSLSLLCCAYRCSSTSLKAPTASECSSNLAGYSRVTSTASHRYHRGTPTLYSLCSAGKSRYVGPQRLRHVEPHDQLPLIGFIGGIDER